MRTTAFFAFADILLVAIGCLLVWSKDLRLGEKIGVSALASLGLMLVVHSLPPPIHT